MARPKRSSKFNILRRPKKLLNRSLSDVNKLFDQGSNTILALGSRVFKTLKSKKRRAKQTRRR